MHTAVRTGRMRHLRRRLLKTCLGFAMAGWLCSVAGCMSLMNQMAYLVDKEVFPESEIGSLGMLYTGTRFDFMLITEGTARWGVTPHGAWIPFFVIDLPFSLCMDTVLLPLTIPESIFVGGYSTVVPLQQPRQPEADFNLTGCPKEGRFIDNQDGTVTDTCTDLMWHKDTADVDGNGSIGDGDRLGWQDALEYCKNLVFAGHNDWRLPNVAELHTIIDYGRPSPPVIDPVFGSLSFEYWSSSICPDAVQIPGGVWYVNFYEGRVCAGDKTNCINVRAVRTIQPGE